MSDKNKSKTTRSDIMVFFLCIYVAIGLVSLVAFTTLSGGPNEDGALAVGFLKGIVWPYSVIEWNLNNE